MKYVFGINATDVDIVASALSQAIGVEFEHRNSSFYGGDYCQATLAYGWIIVQPNDEGGGSDDEQIEKDWPQDQVILYLGADGDHDWTPFVEQIQTMQSPKATLLHTEASRP